MAFVMPSQFPKFASAVLTTGPTHNHELKSTNSTTHMEEVKSSGNGSVTSDELKSINGTFTSEDAMSTNGTSHPDELKATGSTTKHGELKVPNGTTHHDELKFESIPDCIQAFREGQFLIVLDSPNRENEGDLIIAASKLTPETAAFMIHYTSGYLCAPLPAALATHLQLPSMVAPTANTDPNRTAYTVTVDASHGVTTGISATDRARTCNMLGAPGTKADDLRRPGHVVPLIARAGGVRERKGHTEAGWEFARLAGIYPPVAVIGEIAEEVRSGLGSLEVNGNTVLSANGASGRPGFDCVGMMRAEGCLDFGKRWGIKVCTIEELVAHVEKLEGPLKSQA